MEKNNITFRQDVDILRGVAVILVVIYHLDLNLFKSGFVGVDIFFVISGYLIALMYSKSMTAVEFYERRLRRILPATLAIMLIFFCIAPFFFLPFEVRNLSDELIGTLLFAPNLVFWRDNDYFANLDFSPMLHYWSLGVELQYYLIFPVLLYFCRRRHWLIFAVGCISLLASLYLTQVSAKTAFFLLPARLWEFLVGYMAFWLGQNARIQNVSSSTARSYFSVACLVALIGIAMMPIPKAEFPGFYAIPPVLLSFLYILSGISTTSILQSKFILLVRYIAKISFSIYLIHYPVIFIFKYAPFSEPGQFTNMELVASVVITLILSVISYRWVEEPFRNRKSISNKSFVAGVALVYMLSIGVYFVFDKNDYFKHAYSEQEAKIFTAMVDRGAWRCSKLQKLLEYSAESCYLTKYDNAKKNVYLVGDSHIDAIKEVFTDVAKDYKYSLRLNKVRCLLGTYQCSSSSIIKEIQMYKITDVVLHGYDYALFDYRDMQELIFWAKKEGVKIHIVGPVPTYEKSIPGALYKEYHGAKNVIPRIDLEAFRRSIPEAYNVFKAQVESNPSVFFYAPDQYICLPECLLFGADGVYYFDSNHLTVTGERLLEPIVRAIYDR